MSFDTLSIARDLRAVELPAEQAEAIAAAIGRSINEGAASKSDTDRLIARMEVLERAMTAQMQVLERTMTAQMQALDAQITSKIDNARSTLLTWLVGVIVATAGVIIAVLRL